MNDNVLIKKDFIRRPLIIVVTTLSFVFFGIYLCLAMVNPTGANIEISARVSFLVTLVVVIYSIGEYFVTINENGVASVGKKMRWEQIDKVSLESFLGFGRLTFYSGLTKIGFTTSVYSNQYMLLMYIQNRIDWATIPANKKAWVLKRER